jgi:predicted nucleic-acid-binding protein
MPALDTNVLVRWLTHDDPRQSAAVARLFQAVLAAQDRLWIPVTVMLELEWVLRSRYGFDRAAVTEAMDALLSASELDFQSEAALEVALWLFKQAGAPDFADCLHVALANQVQAEPLWSFDERAARLPGVQLVPA